MSPQPVSDRRRGWCPGVRRPMATGDGLLVRLHPFAGRLTADQARLVAEAARAHGNGHLDITARGNLQIRGVSDETYPSLLALLDREGLVEPEGDGPNRLTVLSPLAGLDPLERFDAATLAQAIESLDGVGGGLPAKFFISVDGGGAMALGDIGADLHLAAGETGTVAFDVPSSGGLRGIGTAGLADAPGAVRTILVGFAAMRRNGETEARRLRDLGLDVLEGLAASAGLAAGSPTPRREAAPRAGILAASGGKAVLLALPFGRCGTGPLTQAAAWSERFGTGEMRLSFTRGILVPGLSDAVVPALLEEARAAGFITDAGDPRLSLIACPGRPDCAGAATPAPADALRLAAACPDLLAKGVTLHVSGCPKGCAHPGSADLTLVGRPDGRYDIVSDGSTRDGSLLHLSLDEIMTRLMSAKTSADLSGAFPERAR
ncbi:precorrin-3B synthase [Microvirga sp. HBU67558]|uniref:precorrin-3B synthase n=1 Tax=Microvirga TaxID=186650 RepID=UPI001B35DB42|nr:MULTISPECIES: precorrin-3B synthase [unclassified Microvirga]MBQ0823816.1 precorrin-3B synthase [Microvirga sp. HBU67558]